MRILLIKKNHFKKGGAEKAYFDTKDVLIQNDHKVAFFAMKHKQNEKTAWSKNFVSESDYHKNKQNVVEKIQLGWKIIWNKEAQKKLEKTIDEFKPDVAHLHNIYHQLSPSIIWTLRKKNVPIVMTLHDYKLICPNYNRFVRGGVWNKKPVMCVIDRCVGNSVARSLVCTLEHYFHRAIGSYAKIDQYIAPSKHLIKTFQKHNFFQEIIHVPQYIVQTRTQKKKKTSALKLFFAGRLSGEKGVETILEAMEKLPKETTLTIAGDGPEREYLEKIAKKDALKNRVTFLGHIDQKKVTTERRKADIVIVPSVWEENMPYAVVEALADGAVVVAARIGGITERIKNTQNGFLFTPANASLLAGAVKKAKQSDCEEVSKNAKESVSDLTKRQYYAKIIKVYNQAQQVAKRKQENKKELWKKTITVTMVACILILTAVSVVADYVMDINQKLELKTTPEKAIWKEKTVRRVSPNTAWEEQLDTKAEKPQKYEYITAWVNIVSTGPWWKESNVKIHHWRMWENNQEGERKLIYDSQDPREWNGGMFSADFSSNEYKQVTFNDKEQTKIVAVPRTQKKVLHAWTPRIEAQQDAQYETEVCVTGKNIFVQAGADYWINREAGYNGYHENCHDTNNCEAWIGNWEKINVQKYCISVFAP
ncbi:MAG: glycosyltransferase [Candidatus Moranbacteria bacterium]|nr:glycosyltransferase [Candidatus Moranbacteria bacterium]